MKNTWISNAVRLGAATFMVASIAQTATAATYGYMTGDSEPWNDYGNTDAMDAAFGAGSWDHLTFGDAFSSYQFVYIDGGSNLNTDAFVGYMGTHAQDLEHFVQGGGRLFINAGTEGAAQPIDLVFGATSVEQDDFHKSLSATAVTPTLKLFDGAGTSWNGYYFAHNAIVAPNSFTSLITGDGGYDVVVGGQFGNGYAMLGGQTNASFHEGVDGSDPFQLRVNELRYAAETPATVPEPKTFALWLAGIGVLAYLKRRC